VVDIK